MDCRVNLLIAAVALPLASLTQLGRAAALMATSAAREIGGAIVLVVLYALMVLVLWRLF
jgi:hypothetical protein